MFEVISLIFILAVLVGSLYFVYKTSMQANVKYSKSNIGKVVASFPISYKMSGHIVRIGEKYYFCCENCGIVEVDYSENLDKIMDNRSFQSLLAKQFRLDNLIKEKK